MAPGRVLKSEKSQLLNLHYEHIHRLYHCATEFQVAQEGRD